MGLKGGTAAKRLFRELADHAARPKPALEAIGRNAVNRHIRYFRNTGNQAAVGGGPPKDPWPGLEESTITAKRRGWGQYRGKNKSRKLINTGLLARGFEYRVGFDRVEIFNREDSKVSFLQVSGVGNKKKKFTIVATEPGKQDPDLLKETDEIMANFIFTGKATK